MGDVITSSDIGAAAPIDLHATVVGRVVVVHQGLPRPGHGTAYVDVGTDELLSFTSSSFGSVRVGDHVAVRLLPPGEHPTSSAWTSRCRKTAVLCAHESGVVILDGRLPVGSALTPGALVDRQPDSDPKGDRRRSTPHPPMLVISPIPGMGLG